ncbi:MAG: type III PLP-dependent enzyme [Gammaproteobacteria bacterium]|nr:MAG: type III PLP-dependent enzyme [Gammaproteobacteria bacterium]
MANGRRVIIGAPPQEAKAYLELVAEHGSPLLVFDREILERQYQLLSDTLPDVELYYAVKAHPNEHIVRALDELGCGFDVASAGEMDMLMDLKISGRRTIHTHPIKKDREIRDALRFGATTFVVDNLDELEKLVPYRDRVGILLRVSFSSEDAAVDLSRKFGCDVRDAAGIVMVAGKLGLHIKGLSFHVGSQCENSAKHVEAIEQCHQLMEEISKSVPVPMSTLDIGGGFPADYQLAGIDISSFCAPIRKALGRLPRDWHLLAEPGRFLVAPSVTSITTVTGRSERHGTCWYYLDDGVYGSYSGQIFDHAIYPLQVLKDGTTRPSILAGPTCDSIDVIAEDIQLPELEIGDLVIGHQMGAYTAATKTRFNLLPDARFVCRYDNS